MEKIAIKGGLNNGHKIILHFMSVGAYNSSHLKGCDDSMYYFINEFKIIEGNSLPPTDYTLYESWDEFENIFRNNETI